MLTLRVEQAALGDWSQAIASAAQHGMIEAGMIMSSGPVVVTAAFHLQRPKSAKKDACMIKRPTVRQLEAVLLPALQKIVYNGDEQITGCAISKDYAPAGQPGYVEIVITEGASS